MKDNVLTKVRKIGTKVIGTIKDMTNTGKVAVPTLGAGGRFMPLDLSDEEAQLYNLWITHNSAKVIAEVDSKLKYNADALKQLAHTSITSTIKVPLSVVTMSSDAGVDGTVGSTVILEKVGVLTAVSDLLLEIEIVSTPEYSNSLSLLRRGLDEIELRVDLSELYRVVGWVKCD